ncbi:hypothetical protein [uncultured Anaerococcus sp.]|uniref:hypothetical protein n=1 Tax=uncultured Anaerococcus sp. TaxID=293428 RepID=UPI0025F2FA67|nr:hypothetical protein [uncultured Anaerococcus sp.]
MQTDIIAILPEMVRGKGIYSRIYREGNVEIDSRHPALFLKNFYQERGKSKKEVDKKIKKDYQILRNIPYQIDANHVFFAFKLRETDIEENNRAFINVKYIREIKDNRIILISGEEIKTLNQYKSLRDNRNLARSLLLEEILSQSLSRESTLRYMTGYLIRE